MKSPVQSVYYYHDRFIEILAFVRKTWAAMLEYKHCAFLLRFDDLSNDAQRLLIPMVNRLGAIFNSAHCKNFHIADLDQIYPVRSQMKNKIAT